MSITLNGTYGSTVSLTDPGTQNPATVSSTGVIAVASPDAFSAGLLGVAGFAWTIANFGVVQSTGSYGIGISLESGGVITNGAAGSTAGYIGGRAIGQLSGSTVLGLEDTGALMNRIGKSELCWGEQMSVDDMLTRIASVTPDEVREVARDILGQRPSLSVIGPLKDKQASRLHDAVA